MSQPRFLLDTRGQTLPVLISWRLHCLRHYCRVETRSMLRLRRATRQNPKSRRLREQEITYAQFAKRAQQRHRTLDSLAARFRGEIDEPREFFSRVLKTANREATGP